MQLARQEHRSHLHRGDLPEVRLEELLVRGALVRILTDSLVQTPDTDETFFVDRVKLDLRLWCLLHLLRSPAARSGLTQTSIESGPGIQLLRDLLTHADVPSVLNVKRTKKGGFALFQSIRNI